MNQNELLIDVINNVIPELCNESDIVYIQTIAEFIDDEITVTYSLDTAAEKIESYYYLYQQDGAYCLLDQYDTEFINSIIDLPDLMFYDALELDFNSIDKKAAAAYLEEIRITSGMSFKDFINVLDYQEIYLPDIVYIGFNNIKNNTIDINQEINTLIENASENQEYDFLAPTIETIDTIFIDAADEYIEKAIKQTITTAAIKGRYNNFQILETYNYQEY